MLLAAALVFKGWVRRIGELSSLNYFLLKCLLIMLTALRNVSIKFSKCDLYVYVCNFIIYILYWICMQV